MREPIFAHVSEPVGLSTCQSPPLVHLFTRRSPLYIYIYLSLSLQAMLNSV